MKKFIKKSVKNNLTIAVGRAWFRAWQDYVYHLKRLGVKIIVVDMFNPGWAERLTKIKNKVDAYLWHADTWEENYRKIHDRIYFIENVLNKKVFPDMNMYYSYNDKIKQYEIFKYLKLPIISTHIAFNREKALDIFKKTKKYPIVIKNSYSAVGKGVKKIKNKKELKNKINKIFPFSYEGEKRYLYLQEFIPDMERDLRIITIGNKIACAYWRVSKHWRHNVCLGAKLDFEDIPKQALGFCVKISKQQKFHWMSYDIFVLPNGKIKLIEWSCNFGVKGPREHGVDIRKMQMEYLVDYLSKIS